MFGIRVIGDIHHLDESKEFHLSGPVKLTGSALLELKKALDSGDFDVLALLGDLIESSGDGERDLINMRQILDAIFKTRSRVFGVLGNHDQVGIPRETLEEEFMERIRNQKFEGYEELMDGSGNTTFNYTFQMAGRRFICLHTDLDRDRNPEAFESSVENWIEGVLSRSDGDLIVFSHYPLHLNGVRDLDHNPWFKDRPEKALIPGVSRVFSLFSGYRAKSEGNLVTLVSGHLHDQKLFNRSGCEIVQCGSLVEAIDGQPSGDFVDLRFTDHDLIPDVKLESHFPFTQRPAAQLLSQLEMIVPEALNTTLLGGVIRTVNHGVIGAICGRTEAAICTFGLAAVFDLYPFHHVSDDGPAQDLVPVAAMTSQCAFDHSGFRNSRVLSSGFGLLSYLKTLNSPEKIEAFVRQWLALGRTILQNLNQVLVTAGLEVLTDRTDAEIMQWFCERMAYSLWGLFLPPGVRGFRENRMSYADIHDQCVYRFLAPAYDTVSSCADFCHLEGIDHLWEVGPGVGRDTQSFLDRGVRRVTAFELNPAGMRARFEALGSRIIQGTQEDEFCISYKGEDSIVCVRGGDFERCFQSLVLDKDPGMSRPQMVFSHSVFHLLPERILEDWFGSIYLALIPQGRLVFSHKDLGSWHDGLGVCLWNREGERAWLNPDGMVRYFRSEAFLRRLLEEAGFVVERIHNETQTGYGQASGVNKWVFYECRK